MNVALQRRIKDARSKSRNAVLFIKLEEAVGVPNHTGHEYAEYGVVNADNELVATIKHEPQPEQPTQPTRWTIRDARTENVMGRYTYLREAKAASKVYYG